MSKIYNSHSSQEQIFRLSFLSEISNFSTFPVHFIIKYFSDILLINFNKISEKINGKISELTLSIIGNITIADNSFIENLWVNLSFSSIE